MQPISTLNTSTGSLSYDVPATDGAPPSLLASPRTIAAVSSGDLGAALAVLAVQSGQLERWTATEARNADEQRTEAQVLAEVQAIRAQAGSMRDEAWFDAAASVAQVAATQSSSSGTSSSASTAGSTLAAVKTFGDGMYGADQKEDDANAKGGEAGATSAQNAAGAAHDVLADASDLINAALSFYREYVATRAQTSTAALVP
jgi:hypothetical protein